MNTLNKKINQKNKLGKINQNQLDKRFSRVVKILNKKIIQKKNVSKNKLFCNQIDRRFSRGINTFNKKNNQKKYVHLKN